MRRVLLCFAGLSIMVMGLSGQGTSAVAVGPSTDSTPLAETESAATVEADDRSAPFIHPLSWAVESATKQADYIRSHVRDYTCRLIKRERIEGELQALQFARLKVRSEQQVNGEVVKPFAVFMQFLAPSTLEDRRLLYIKGQNGEQVLVRKGGSLLKYMKVSVDPNGAAARRESNYPITDVGFDKLVGRLIECANSDIARDPLGENSEVLYFKNARIGERKCTHIRIRHPESTGDMQFHIASLYVDEELQVPTRLVVYDWPAQPGEKPPLMEEYIYDDIRLNVGLTDADFDESHLDSSPGR